MIKKPYLLLLLVCLFFGSFLSAADSYFEKDTEREVNKKYVEGEILVKYQEDKIDLQDSKGRSDSSNFIQSKSLELKEELKTSNISLLKIKDGKSVEQKIKELESDSRVEYAQPNFQYHLTSINTNDTHRGLLWGLNNTGQAVKGDYYTNNPGTIGADIKAPEAWAINEGTNAEIIVAIIDTGVAYNHPDLVDNMWDGVNCKDHNGNFLGGCNHGYDHEYNDKTPLPETSEFYFSHGTHIAGTIAGVKNNNEGVVGVAPRAKIMALKTGLTTADIIQNINFARHNGASVINASWGGSEFDQAMKDAIATFPGLFVTTAGNDANNNDGGYSFYPSDFNLDNIISVAATDQSDALATFSSYGAVSVDVGAPGTNIYSSGFVQEIFTGGDNNIFTATGNWLVGDWNSPVGDKYASPNSSYVNNDYGTLTLTNPINTTVHEGNPYLFFYFNADIEVSGGCVNDYLSIEVDNNDSNWVEKARVCGSYSAGYYSANLGAGKENMRIRFVWSTNESVVGSQIPKIDDISISNTNSYQYMNGTSMAAPHVAGLAALIWGVEPSLTLSQLKSTIMNTGDSVESLSGKTVSGKRINAEQAIRSITTAKAITDFKFEGLDPVVVGSIDEEEKTIILNVPNGTSVTSIVPTIAITGESVNPASGVAQDFTSSVTYSVTAFNASTQDYLVTVVVDPIPDVDLVAEDKEALVANSIKGENIDLSNITVALTNPLPSIGDNGSAITWSSSNPNIVSHDGQTINRPLFANGDATVTLTATLTKGEASDTKEFELIVLKLPASTIATITSGAYTVSSGGTESETITDIPFGTSKPDFLEALVKGEENQIWDDSQISNPVTSTNTLVVTAQDGTTTVTYALNVNLNPAKRITGFTISDQVGITTINEEEKTIILTVPYGTSVTSIVPTITITGESVSPASGVAQDFTEPVTYSVTAEDSSTQDYLVTVVLLEETQTVPDVDGNATGTTSTPQIILTNPDQEVSILFEDGINNPTINLSSFIQDGAGAIPSINIVSENANNATISIPSTTVTSTDSSWGGVISAPIIATVSLPQTSDKTRTLSTAIELGFSGAKLSFNKGIRILIAGQAGKRAGYTRAGIDFTEIVNVCSGDSQVVGDELSIDGDCKIDVGSDLVIWTKHFTKFATYTESTIVRRVSGGGGGGSSTPTTPTTNTGEVTATPSAGGKTTLTTEDGPTVKIEVPANAIVSDTKFEVKTSTMEEVVSAGTTGSAPQSFVMVGGKVYQLTATGGSGQSITTFSKDVTLSFTYTDEEIANLDEDSLKVYRWNGTEWVALPSTVNKATNTVSATTSQFSNFALMGEEKTEEAVVDTTGMTQDQLRAEIARLIALIATLQAQIAQSQGITSSGACDGVTFSRNLSLGMTGGDVKCLQTILNRSVDTQIAVSGVGSIGNETNYFGGLTRGAVIKFQNKYASEVLTPIGLTTGTGYVGGKTIAKLNQILGR